MLLKKILKKFAKQKKKLSIETAKVEVLKKTISQLDDTNNQYTIEIKNLCSGITKLRNALRAVNFRQTMKRVVILFFQ